MTTANMARHATSPWMPFWRELKRGYDLFEATREVPVAAVERGHYVVFAGHRSAPVQSARMITAWR